MVTEHTLSKRLRIGLIGVGAFGTLAAKHLAPFADVIAYDKNQKSTVELSEAASCPFVILAVPVQALESVIHDILPHVQKSAVIIDVCSVKVKPVAMMQTLFPEDISLVGTHPLFGPQSGKNGIAGLNLALCPVRGKRHRLIELFLRRRLGVRVVVTTAENHDRQMAYVQGLTHLIAKVIVSLDLPPFELTTRTFDHMNNMVDMVRYDSDELFRAIARENPFVDEAKTAFFAAARRLEERLSD